ncbi:MAG: immune inhibitor A [Anaerolineales bacterium]|nr:immune inhibitor A [Anaerolineales bacterium]
MLRNFIFIIVFAGLLISGCGSRETTTATEPQFTAVSTEPVTKSDMELYTALSSMNPIPSNRIDLAIAIEGLDPSSLPVPPNGPVQIYQVGDAREFWVHNSSSFEFTRITARLMFISKHAYFWQDEGSKPVNASGEFASERDWAAAGESFDSSYEKVRAVFGYEEAPGLDGDARLFVIHSDSLGNVGGYFGQADQLPAEVEAHSNQGQFFFISNSGSSGIASDYYKEVLAHEFQHMIHKKIDPNEEGWMNEGLSMLAQQVAGMRGYNSVADYLAKPDQSLWYWSSSSQDYGQAFLYLEYIYEQVGEEFISALVADSMNGLASIDKTLTKFDSPRSADQLNADSFIAAFFNDAALGREYVFNTPVIPAITPRYEFTSLPAIYEGVVQQYGGVDIMTFTGDQEASLTFTGDQVTGLIPASAHSGENFWWSNRYDSTFSTLTREIDLRGVTKATLKYWAWYDIEEDWDYAYLLVSTDNGEHWTLVPVTSSRETDPNDQNLGHGFSGKSGEGEDAVWIEESADLSTFAGSRVLIRFAMQNDLVANNFGFAVDDISIPEINWSDDAETADGQWSPEGFILIHNRIPQVWSVRAVEQNEDGSILVRELEVTDGIGTLNVDFDDLKRIVVFVIGQTRYTTIPASYRIVVSPTTP